MTDDADHRRDVLQHIADHGLETAFVTAHEIATDHKASPTARVAAARVLGSVSEIAGRALGVMDGRAVEELTVEETQTLLASIRRQIRQAEAVDVIEHQPAADGGVFD